ncbi:hypothetical protein KEM48_001264 [Puccinia striiformis f. sp. tritici PST-130]|nr:hypothetical protein KEM48_001264 [Puccinia striiformis f. sp. tritici PST-130]
MSTEDNPIEPALLHPHLFNDLNNGMIEFPIIAYDPFHPINNKTYHSTFIDQSTPSWPSDPFLPFDYQLNTTADQLQLPTSDLAVGNQLGLDIDSTSFSNPNSIECWIDFTGGESSSSSISGGDRNGKAVVLVEVVSAAVRVLPLHHHSRPSIISLPPLLITPSPPILQNLLLKTLFPITKPPLIKINEGRNEFLERNRLAASRSRAKKKTYQTFLEDQARRLEAEHVKLNQIIQDLIVEKNQLQSIVMDHQLTATTTTLNHHHYFSSKMNLQCWMTMKH